MTSPNDPTRGPGKGGQMPGDQTAGGLADDARKMASDVADKTREVASSVVERVQAEAGEFADKAKQKAMETAEEGKEMGASRLAGVAEAAHAAADALEERVPEFAGYAHRAARSIEDFSRDIRTRSVADMLQSANAFARREPVAVFGATLLAGFAVARFLSSSSRPHGADDVHSSSRFDQDRFGQDRFGGAGMMERGETGARLRSGGMSGTGQPQNLDARGEQNSGRNTTGEGVSRGFGRGPAGGMARGVGEGPPPSSSPGSPGPASGAGLGEGGISRGTPGGEGGVSSMTPSSVPGASQDPTRTGAGGGSPGFRPGAGGGRRGGQEPTDKVRG